MKVLLTVHQFFPQYRSGTEVLTYSVAKELTRRGHQVRILTGYPTDRNLLDEERFEEYEFDGLHIYRFCHSNVPMGGQTSLVEINYDNQLSATFFSKILEDFEPDVVHFFHLSRLGTRLIECAKQANTPAYMTPTDFWSICITAQLVLCDGAICNGPRRYAGNCAKHMAQENYSGVVAKLAKRIPDSWVDSLVKYSQFDAVPHFPHKEDLKAIGERLSINIARLNQLNRIIVPNSLMAETLARFGVNRELIVQSAYGIDVAVAKESAPRLGPRKPFRIGFIGSLIEHKGCHVLIQAFRNFSFSEAVLKIYGNMDEIPGYSERLLQLAEGSQNIEFCGVFPNSQISNVMDELDVLVVPSLWYENTPLVVYSAQAAKCVVVASDFPGISEVIKNEKNGLLFKPGDIEDLANQLSRLMNEPALLNRLSAQSMLPKSTDQYVDELLSFWEQV